MTVPAQPTTSDRALAAMRLLVRSFFPQFLYWIAHEYAVQESDGATFSGLPTDASFSPALPTRVPYSPSLAGSSCVVPVGILAYVAFANADPSKPYLVRFGAGLPTSATVDASGVATIGPSAGAVQVGRAPITSPLAAVGHFVRFGDVVSVGAATGPVTLLAPAPVSTGKS